MAQTRKILRQKIKERLLENTKAGKKVNERYLEFKEPYPCIMVTTPEDTSTLYSNSIRSTNHSLEVAIDVIEESSSITLNDSLDDLAEEIETQIDSDETFDGILTSLVLKKTETEVKDDGEKSYGFLRLTYEAEYQKQKTPIAKPGPQLKKLDVGGVHGN